LPFLWLDPKPKLSKRSKKKQKEARRSKKKQKEARSKETEKGVQCVKRKGKEEEKERKKKKDVLSCFFLFYFCQHSRGARDAVFLREKDHHLHGMIPFRAFGYKVVI